jgi:hypothetical protein
MQHSRIFQFPNEIHHGKRQLSQSLTILQRLLVGDIPTPLKNHGVKVSWDDEILNIWKNKKCSKPPTSLKFFAGSYCGYTDTPPSPQIKTPNSSKLCSQS